MAPSNHSRESARKTSPGLMLTAAGMSGCHLLCPTIFWSLNFLVLSIGNRFFGIFQDLSFVRCLSCLQLPITILQLRITIAKIRDTYNCENQTDLQIDSPDTLSFS